MPPCPVCLSNQTVLWSTAKDYEYFSTSKNYSYFQCADCYSIFIDPVPVDELMTIYPSNYYSFVTGKKNVVVKIKEWLDKKYFRILLKNIDEKEIRVLDVGGGTGWLSSLIKDTDERVIHTQIVDIDPAAKQLALSNGHAYFEGTLENFTTEEEYDLVLMLNLIEHVSDPLAVLQKASSLLTSNGIILIKTPNTKCWDARLFKKTYWGGLHAPRHWVIFSEKSFRHLVSATSLRIDQLKYTQGAAFWAFSIIAWLSKRNITRTSARRPIVFHPLFPLISGPFAVIDFIRSLFSKTAQMFIVLKNNKKPG
jgi:2-polyprenyl-3-methyl-5-hydroxy-6-metoxy-1,4-benzoquinol methylase